MAPLAHAVRLVDREKSELGLVETLEKSFGREALRRDIDEIETAGDHAGFALTRRLIGKCRIDERGAHAGLTERRDLILHQSYQRRDHDGDAAPHQCRDLVTEALPATGGHEHERGIAADNMLDDPLLLPAKARIAEDFPQERL